MTIPSTSTTNASHIPPFFSAFRATSWLSMALLLLVHVSRFHAFHAKHTTTLSSCTIYILHFTRRSSSLSSPRAITPSFFGGGNVAPMRYTSHTQTHAPQTMTHHSSCRGHLYSGFSCCGRLILADPPHLLRDPFRHRIAAVFKHAHACAARGSPS